MLARAFLAVLVAALRIPAGAARSLTCVALGHRPNPEWPTICGRCGTDL